MSKNQIFSLVSPSKITMITKKIPIRFVPILKNSSKKQIKSLCKQRISFSKSRDNITINSSLQPETKNNLFVSDYETMKTQLAKQVTISTEMNSDRFKDINLLESKLRSIDIEKGPKGKYLIFLDIWPELIKQFSNVSSILDKLKNGIEEYISHMETELETHQKINSDYKETKTSLKNLKRRYQKLAFENLEINNLLKESENAYYKKKDELKVHTKQHKADISEKNKIIQNLNKLMQEIYEQLRKSSNDDFTSILIKIKEYYQIDKFDTKEFQKYENRSIDPQNYINTEIQNISLIEMKDECQMLNPSRDRIEAGSFFFSGSEGEFNN